MPALELSGQVSQFAAAGIMWDISGALFLSRGYLFVSNEKLAKISESAWGMSFSKVRYDNEQRIHTQFGLSQLIVGFLIQMAAALGVRTSSSVALSIVLCIGLVWLWYAVNVKIWVLRNSLRMIDPQDDIY